MSVNVEALVVQFLMARPAIVAAELFVSMDAPAETKSLAGWVTVERAGGGVSEIVVDHPMVAVQVWGHDRWQVSEHARLVADELKKMILLPEVGACSINAGPYNFPTASNEPRYQIVLDLVTVG